MHAERITQTVDIVKHSMGIEEKGVKLRLTIVDTPGFGDAVNNTERYSECLASEECHPQRHLYYDCSLLRVTYLIFYVAGRK